MLSVLRNISLKVSEMYTSNLAQSTKYSPSMFFVNLIFILIQLALAKNNLGIYDNLGI